MCNKPTDAQSSAQRPYGCYCSSSYTPLLLAKHRDERKSVSNYIQYTTADGSTLLVEVREEEVLPPEGAVKAGVADTIEKSVAQAQSTFEGAIDRVVRQNAQVLIESVRNLQEPPHELEVTFGLKATGEVGNIAIARGGGEANFTVRLLWTPTQESGR